MVQFTSSAAMGTGPVDAAYKAIDAIVKTPSTLLEFNVHAVTEGIDALGEVTVRIQSDERPARRWTRRSEVDASAHLWRPRRRHRHHRRQRQGLSQLP